jgi:hypothetical protein
MNTTIDITEGSTSTDSCKLEDIVNGVRFLSDADSKLSHSIGVFDSIKEIDMPNVDMRGFIFDEICERLNELAPVGLTFGAHECDGADYGFWSLDQGDYEDNPGSFGYPITNPEP